MRQGRWIRVTPVVRHRRPTGLGEDFGADVVAGRAAGLIEIDADFRGLTPAAVLDDVGMGLSTVGAYDGVEVVTDSTGLRIATEWAAFVVPFPMRVFPAGPG